jgi:hypothetical protein
MSSLMQVAQNADRLVLSYPLWIGVMLLLGAAVLLALTVFGSKRIRRRWTLTIATAVAAWAGLYFATFNATITNEAGSVYAFLADQHSVRWKDATDIYLERRGGGRDWHIVVLDAHQRAFDFNVADLSVDDRDRVMAYMVDRMPDNAFPRSPTLLKRQAPYGPRPVGLFSDQQT